LATQHSTPVVVVGTGSIGLRHLSVLRERLDVQALALPAGRLGERDLRGATAVASLAEAKAKGAQHAIIATTTARHIADGRDALELGMHVLVEKPLAPSATGLRTLAASARGRSIFVGCCLRFHPALRRFRTELPTIGRVYDARIECRSFLPDWRPSQDHRESYSARPDEGGVLRDLIHEIDYAIWLFGAPREVRAVLGSGAPISIASEASADLLWEAPDGPVVSLRLDYLTRTARRGIYASGEHGSLEVDLVGSRVRHEVPGEPARIIDVAHERDAMMAAQTQAFLRASSGGDPDALATFADGAFALAVCDAARLSDATKRAEPVKEWT
jgi:predicted dehydrogenase